MISTMEQKCRINYSWRESGKINLNIGPVIIFEKA